VIGERIQNYVVTTLLGEGGMGAVYIGQHPVIDRKVAIKVLKRELAADKSLVERFVNEARAANVIRHPNIVEILDVGTLADGLPYIIMELLSGESLAQRLQRTGRLGLEYAVHIAVQTMSALAAAHARGIVHRDLKPDNLFLVHTMGATAPSREVVKVLDFGIAKIKRDVSNSKLTSTGSLIGTPTYMSPEQCRGITAEVDHLTDVYAMGAIVYEMLCGRPPFVSEGVGEILIMHLTRPPEPLRALNPGVPPHVERAVLAALEKQKTNRPQTMQAFQALLLEGGQAITRNEDAFAPTALPPDPATWVPNRDPSSETGPNRQSPAEAQGGAAPTHSPPSTTFSSAMGQVYAAAEDSEGALEEEEIDAYRASKAKHKHRLIFVGGTAAVLLLAALVVIAKRGGDGSAGASGASEPTATAVAPAAEMPPAAPPVAQPSPGMETATPDGTAAVATSAPQTGRRPEPEAIRADDAARTGRDGRGQSVTRTPRTGRRTALSSPSPSPSPSSSSSTSKSPAAGTAELKPSAVAPPAITPPSAAKKAKKW
jgi:serine/threonine protein kinase